MKFDFSDFDFRLQIYVFGEHFSKTYFSCCFDDLVQFWDEHDEIVSHVSVIRFGQFVACIDSLDELKAFEMNYKRYENGDCGC